MHASILRVGAAELEAPETVMPSRTTIDGLFADHVGFVWRSLRRFGVADADLEDQTQEVFIVANHGLSRWDAQHPRAWLYEIARRCAATYRRQSHRRRERVVETMPETRDPRDPSLSAEVDLLSRILASIDEEKRSVFILHQIEELPMREVAEAIQCPLQTAYTRLYAARRALARALEEMK